MQLSMFGEAKRVDSNPAKPFLKWAGGKSQLIEQMSQFLPAGLAGGSIRRYVEPFVGGGAIFFHLAQAFALEELLIADVNPELTLVYRVIQRDVDGLVDYLKAMEQRFLSLKADERKTHFYEVRTAFNEALVGLDFSSYGRGWIERAATWVSSRVRMVATFSSSDGWVMVFCVACWG